MHLDIISTPMTPHRFSLSPYPPKFVFFLSKTKYKKLWNTNKLWSLFHVSQLLLSMRPVLECGCYTQYHSIEENIFFFSQQLSIANSFSVEIGTFCLLSFLHAGVLCVLNLCRSWAHCDSVCKFIRASVLLCLVSLVSSVAPTSHNHSASSSAEICELWRERCDKEIVLWDECTLSSCDFLCSPPSTAISFFGDAWTMHWSLEITICH